MRKTADTAPGPKKQTERGSFWLDLAALALRLAWIGLFFAVLLCFVVGITVQHGTDMQPSFRDRDVVVYYRLSRELEADDVIVYSDGTGPRLGRIVATGGDQVDVDEGGLKINGYYQDEWFAVGETLPFTGGVSFPLTVPEGTVFVLCDNRDQSTDSRILGPVVEQSVLGRVLLSIRQRQF